MGCYNETCLISRLPILKNDKVKWFLVYEQFGIWIPLTIGFDGEYDNYGRPFIKDKIDKRFKLFSKWAKPLLKHFEEHFHWPEIDENISDWKFLEQLCECRDRIVLLTNTKINAEVENIINGNIEQFTNTIKDAIKTIEYLNLYPYFLDDIVPRVLMIHSDIYNIMIKSVDKPKYFDTEYSERIKNKYTPENPPQHFKLYCDNDIEEFYKFWVALREMRIEWRPPANVSSQEEQFDVNYYISLKLPKIIKKLRKRHNYKQE